MQRHEHNFNGKTIKRGTKIKFKGFSLPQENGIERVLAPCETYIWIVMPCADAVRFFIEHPNGFELNDMVEGQPSATKKMLLQELQPNKKYTTILDEDIEDVIN